MRASPRCSARAPAPRRPWPASPPDLPAGLAISGRVDRLVVEPRRVLVVDFKTNRPAPDRIEDADPAYLAADGGLCRRAAPRSSPAGAVEAALVWTDGPKLMPVPENVIAATLAELRASVDAAAGAYMAT